jgi:type IV secretory pathway component VirB8
MNEEIKKRLEEQDKLLQKIYKSIERTRRYFLWTLIISVLVIVLPLIGLALVIPKFLSIYDAALGGL